MATAVTISIVVDSAQAQQAAAALNTTLAQTGTSATTSFQKAGTAVQQLGGHTTTALDGVRLLSQEFGLRLPRAMEAMLSRMPAVTSAISSVIGGLAAVAAVEVFLRLADEAKKLYDQVFDVNKAMRDMAATAGAAANQKLFDEASLQTGLSLIRQTNAEIQKLEAKRVASGADKPGGGFLQYVAKYAPTSGGSMMGNANIALQAPPDHVIYSSDDGKRQAEDTKNQAEETLRTNEKARQLAMETLKDKLSANEQALKSGALLNAQQQDAHRLNEQAMQDQRSREDDLIAAAKANRDFQLASGVKEDDPKLTHLYQRDPNSGAAERNVANAKADEDAAAKKVNLDRETSLAIMKAQDQVVQAGLEGDALEERKKTDSIREITLQLKNQMVDKNQIAAEVAAVEAKFDNEHYDRLEKQWHDAQQAQRTASQSGLTGAAKIEVDHGNRLDQINSDRTLDPAVAAQLRIAAKTEQDQKLRELDDNFTRATLLDAETRTAAELGAFERIEAEAKKAIAEKQKAYDELGGSGGASASNAFNADKTAIEADASRKRSQLTQQNNAVDLQYAQEAARAEARVKEQGIFGWVAAYKNGIAEINAEDQRRTAQMQEQAAKQGATQEEIAARKVDIDRQANAQIAEQNLQMQHQIAGDLQSAFTNPVQFIKSAMEKMFFEIIASWVMKMHGFQAVFGNTMGGLKPGGGGVSGGAGSASGGAQGGLLAKLTQGGGGAFNSGISQGGYTSGSSASNGGISGGGTIGSGSTGGANGGGGIGSSISGIGSLAQTALSLPHSFSSGGSPSAAAASSGLNYNDATGQFDTVADPSINSTLATVPGFGGSTAVGGGGAALAAGAIGAGMGAYTGEQATVAAYQSGSLSGTLQGTLADAGAGLAIGSLFGPEGALIGAGVGAAVGLASGVLGMIGDMGPKNKARNYYKQSIRPSLDAAAQNTNYGDFQTAIANVNSISGNGLVYMKSKFGNDAGNWVNDNYMRKYVEKIDTMIESSASGGRQFTQMSAKQFHSGGTISGFGSFATSSDEGYIHAKVGETVMTPGASSSHGPMLSAMNAGASAADIAGAYLAQTGAGVPASGGSGGDTHFHVHTLDTKTMTSWLRGGGAKMITKEQNNYNAQYAGDGIGG